MKLIHAWIEGDQVVVDMVTPTDIELTEKPAWKNWDKLRKLGYVNCQLQGDPKEAGLTWHLPETDLEKLEIEMATYDWYYEMSDDARVYNAGRAQDGRIFYLAQKVGQEKYKELWTIYVEQSAKKYRDPEEHKRRYLARFEGK